MGVFIEPEAIAEAVIFLASNCSKSTTGVVLNVDGGQSL
jgi:NAD(P)-dependent dehydrogenase (short-subunit alcohol dehydrogenase family)